jgi:hypothetical protein
MKNNLQIINTGLDHLYINGLPIVEAKINIQDIYARTARLSALAVQADPYFNDRNKDQKIFSETHGEGDRITRDFLEEGARDLLPVFVPLQRFIPEGRYDTTPVEIESLGHAADYTWANADHNTFIDNIWVRVTQGSGDLTFEVNGVTLGTVTLPETEENVYMPYALPGYLGGYNNHLNFIPYILANPLGGSNPYLSWEANQNTRGYEPMEVKVIISNQSAGFTYDVKLTGAKYDAIGWVKALTNVGDVAFPSKRDDIRIGSLSKTFRWDNNSLTTVTGVTVKHNSGGANVTIKKDNIIFMSQYLASGLMGDNISEDITSIEIEVSDASEDFSYDLIINTNVPQVIPSPRFEFDSGWNPGQIIYRYQNMDTRIDKMNYTSETLRDIRVDPNIFDEVVKYLNDALKNYVLKELYLAIGDDKRYAEYVRKYEQARAQVKFWVRSEKGLQTQYNYAGV